jgi:hypothetical protein
MFRKILCARWLQQPALGKTIEQHRSQIQLFAGTHVAQTGSEREEKAWFQRGRPAWDGLLMGGMT